MKTAESEIMDYADDIAYSVHDLEDFHRCGIIPWHKILSDDEKENLVKSATKAWHNHPIDAAGRLREAFESIKNTFLRTVRDLIETPYEASRTQRQQLRYLTSSLIGRFQGGIHLVKSENFDGSTSPVFFDEGLTEEIKILKEITRLFVIKNPALAAQQHGHKRIITKLFEYMYDDICASKDADREPLFVPIKFRHLLMDGKTTEARATADCIASLTEAEAIALYGRLTGNLSGSVLDPIVR